MENPIARVRGLGSAREGGHHWWVERMTSVAAFLLYAWLLVSLLRLRTLDYGTVREWLADPWAAVPMLLLLFVTFVHLRDGLRVVIEDYVHDEGNRFFALLLVNFLAVGGGTLAIFSVLRIAFTAGGAAAGLR
ncbi:MAG: succinate dehydrogenase, hydrophobic membrane anchor protein [Alphaproteobacteria bacterium]|nr:succinate dehydrogenase, hydrophobic membrane anchor protein [Alphaproteobacteria bacterium]MBV9371141.1 succinate dehydrogenase, hydrophobic membrane anchor protein [Alphaproteobacteria bacterium]MBV9901214.1 succinate dehydrogenase, hydrophobic membrane anchor protein [Alphaproteobacteria bacterium]